MTTFFRFPHTPHLAWLGAGHPRHDKVLSVSEATSLLDNEVVVEEKIDGANLGFSRDETGQLLAQNRGQFLSAPYVGQFSKLSSWLAAHEESLVIGLEPDWILFGEWCAARHSIQYLSLPDWWLLFDVFDRRKGKFLSTAIRNAMAKRSGLSTVAEVFRGKTTLKELRTLLMERPSSYGAASIEGLVVRSEVDGLLSVRAKLVRPDFTQSIDQHWRSRSLEWNRLL